MIEYNFRDDILRLRKGTNSDPQKIGKEVERLRVEARARLGMDSLRQAAKENPNHPCHNLYEWDAEKAAINDWQRTSMTIITSLVETDTKAPDPSPTRSYYSITDDEGASYRSTREVKDSLDLQLAVIKRCESDMR
jgi:hypothetical protein